MNRYIDGDDDEKCDSREKSYFLPLFENILISRCHGVVFYKQNQLSAKQP